MKKINLDFDMPKSLGLSSIKKTFERKIAISETKFHRGSLRSGQKLETEGSIIILGDVNSGAEVIASDNIVVLGTLRGLAHAGAKGNKQAIIAAGLFDAVQVRIANIVKEIDREEEPLHKQAYISVVEDKIETEEVAFVPMTKEIDDETAYNAFGTITSKSGNNYVIVVKSEKELTQDNLETVAEAVKEQVK